MNLSLIVDKGMEIVQEPVIALAPGMVMNMLLAGDMRIFENPKSEYDNGSGDGSGYQAGNGYGDGYEYGSGYGSPYGSMHGTGTRYGNGSGSGVVYIRMDTYKCVG